MGEDVNKRYLSYMLASLMSDWKARMLIFPTLYRLDRCEVKDANAIAELANIVFAPPTSTGPPLSSQWYAMQVALSELKEDPAPTSDELRQRVKDHLITLQLTQSLLNIYDFWPRYPQDEYMGKWAKTSVPMLMLHGEIDPRTPLRIGEPAKQQFTSTNQHFVTIPNGTHGTLLQSPLGGGQLPCAMQITISFLKEPTQTPDKSCLPNILKLDFKGTPQNAQAIFKTNDYWD